MALPQHISSFASLDDEENSGKLEICWWPENSERELRRIKFEWQQVTRMIDRMIMFGYIVVTIVFAVYMLATREGEIRLTEEVMDRVKRSWDEFPDYQGISGHNLQPML